MKQHNYQQVVEVGQIAPHSFFDGYKKVFGDGL